MDRAELQIPDVLSMLNRVRLFDVDPYMQELFQLLEEAHNRQKSLDWSEEEEQFQEVHNRFDMILHYLAERDPYLAPDIPTYRLIEIEAYIDTSQADEEAFWKTSPSPLILLDVPVKDPDQDPGSLPVLALTFLSQIRIVLEQVGLQPVTSQRPELGSVFKRWVVRSSKKVTSREIKDAVSLVARGLELHQLEYVQSQVDERRATAFATVLSAGQLIPTFVVRLGSMLVIKITDNGQPCVTAVTLSQRQLIALDSDPGLLRDPPRLLEALRTDTDPRSADSSLQLRDS